MYVTMQKKEGDDMGKRKKYAEPDYTDCCVFCEYALPKEGDEDLIQCMRRRKKPERSGGFGCKHFRYDLLKHKPAVKKSPEPIDEELRDL